MEQTPLTAVERALLAARTAQANVDRAKRDLQSANDHASEAIEQAASDFVADAVKHWPKELVEKVCQAFASHLDWHVE